MSENNKDEIMDGSFKVNLAEFLRPVDQIFPEAHRSVAITMGYCASAPMGCGEKIEGFKDELSAREYKITGFCQKCQDKIFEEPDEPFDDKYWDPEAKGGV